MQPPSAMRPGALTRSFLAPLERFGAMGSLALRSAPLPPLLMMRFDRAPAWLKSRKAAALGEGRDRARLRLPCLLRAYPAALDGLTRPGGEAGPLGAQLLPQVLEPAAGKAADPTAFGPPQASVS